MVWIGLISYSLYLVHWPTIVFSRYVLLREFTAAETAALIVTSFALAYLSYRFIEQPFRHPRPAARPRSTLAAGVATLAAIAVFGLVGVKTNGLPQRFPGFAPHEIAAQNEWMMGRCFLAAKQPWQAWDPSECTRTVGHSRSILLWGDSFAAHYVPGLIRRSDELGANIVQYTAGGCRPILSFVSYALPNCHAFNARVPDIIRSMKIDEVIISARWISLRSRGLADLRNTIEQLEKLGVKVSVIGQSPEFPIDVQTLAYRQRNDDGGKIGRWPILFDQRINKEIRAIAGDSVSFIDPLKSLCDGSTCQYMDGDNFLYRDFGHFSALGSDRAVGRYFALSDAPRRNKNAEISPRILQ
jgi:hypothetical protein